MTNQQTPFDDERLHPETLRTLRELVKLHGVARLIGALIALERQRVVDEVTVLKETREVQ